MELNQYIISTRYAWIVFFLFKILDHDCTTSFVFEILYKILFQKLFANSQRYMNKIERSIFKIWNFLPLFQMLFLWLEQNSPSMKFSSYCSRGFYKFLKILSPPFWKHIKILIWKLHFKIWWWGGAVFLLWANTFSPFGMNRQKRTLEWNISPFTFPQWQQINMSEDYTRAVRNTGKE